jgi:hypothetical protein
VACAYDDSIMRVVVTTAQLLAFRPGSTTTRTSRLSRCLLGRRPDAQCAEMPTTNAGDRQYPDEVVFSDNMLSSINNRMVARGARWRHFCRAVRSQQT